MKALLCRGPGKTPQPRIQDATDATDAVVMLAMTAICGAGLHIPNGDAPTCAPGRILRRRHHTGQAQGAYDTFARGAGTHALKAPIEFN